MILLYICKKAQDWCRAKSHVIPGCALKGQPRISARFWHEGVRHAAQPLQNSLQLNTNFRPRESQAKDKQLYSALPSTLPRDLLLILVESSGSKSHLLAPACLIAKAFEAKLICGLQVGLWSTSEKEISVYGLMMLKSGDIGVLRSSQAGESLKRLSTEQPEPKLGRTGRADGRHCC